MDIDFDPDKASKNLIKHGVSFDEAITVFYDSQALAFEDPDTEGEARWVLVGMSGAVRLLTVVYTERNMRIRLISARKATRKEARIYAR